MLHYNQDILVGAIWMEQRVPFVRVLKLSRLLETFFIASVTSILVIRAFLAATGYPQLGGHGLHIAHMLWGDC